MIIESYIRMACFFVYMLIMLVPLYGLAQSQPAGPEGQEGSSLWEGVKGLQERFKTTGEQQQTPPDIAQRLKEDAERIGAWEYRVVSLQSTPDAELEKELNTLGLERWEAFSVQSQGEGLRVFLKRPASSYLQAVPMGEYLRFIPKTDPEAGPPAPPPSSD